MNKRDAVRFWQQSEHVHSMTCRKDSSHGDLDTPSMGEDWVRLMCRTCGYKQDYIPRVVIEAPRMVERGEITEEEMAGANMAFFMQDAPAAKLER